MTAPAGWHKQTDGQERYWDGTQWTEQFRPSPEPPVANPSTRSLTTSLGSKRHLIGYGGTGLLALLVGVAIGASGDSTELAASTTSGSSPVVTKTVAGPAGQVVTSTTTVSVPGPTKTVESPKPAKTVTVKVTPVPKAAILDGTWEVGVDIKAGTYKVIEPVVGDCYWSITRTGTDDIINNDIVHGGRPVVILKNGQEFENNGCGDWSRVR